MIRLRTTAAAAALALAAVALGGCISLLPKAKPAQLYRFGGRRRPRPSAAPTPAKHVDVVRAGVDSTARPPATAS